MKKHVLVLASASLVIAGCSATDDTNPAPSAARSSTTAAVSASPSSATPVTGDQLAYTTQTAFSQARTVRFSSTMGNAGEITTSTGHLALDGTDVGIRFVSDGFEVIKIGNGMWAQSDGSGWMDTAEGEGPGALLAAVALVLLAPADQPNLARALGAVDDLELVAEEDLDGVATRHYRGSTDHVAYAETQQPKNGVWQRALQDGAAVSIDVWVDADDRIVRFTQSSTDATGTPFTFTTDFSEYGADVTVAPPA